MQFATVSDSQVVLKVVNGAAVRTNMAGDSPFPFFVQIRRIVQGGKVVADSYSQMVCGGSIVHAWGKGADGSKAGFWVVTAAHCLQVARQTYSVNVFMGPVAPYTEIRNNDIFGPGIPNADGWYEIPPGNILIYNHPSYDRETLTHDVALIRCILPTGMDLPKGMQLAALPKSDVVPKQCNILGFGITDVRNAQNSTTLRYGSVRADDSSVPQKTSALPKFNPEFHTWAAGETNSGDSIDACQGDSGGPLFHIGSGEPGAAPRFTLFGVASWGISCGLVDFPGVFAKVWPFVQPNTLSPASSPWSQGIIAIINDNSPTLYNSTETNPEYQEPKDQTQQQQQTNSIFQDPSTKFDLVRILKLAIYFVLAIVAIAIFVKFSHEKGTAKHVGETKSTKTK